MKTMNCICAVLTVLACSAIAPAIDLVNPSFEADGALDPGTPTGWMWNGAGGRGTASTPGDSVTDGAMYMWQGNGSVLYQTTDIVIANAGVSYTLTADVRPSWHGSPQIILYYTDDGGVTRTPLGSAHYNFTDFPETGEWGGNWQIAQELELTAATTADSVGKYLGVELTIANYPGDVWVHYDNVRLESNTVRLLSPAHQAEQVSIQADLFWEVAPTVEYVDLYFADDPNFSADPGAKKLDMEPATTTGYDPGVLAFETTYYWRVDAYEPNLAPGGSGYLITQSGTRSFTTRGPNPGITAITPYSQAVIGDGTADALMTVSGDNLEFYEWYKEGDPNPLTDGGKYSGVDTGTLTIHNVVLADEGVYYCVASNSISPNTDTASAVLVTPRLMSWWKLDGDLSDSVQELYPTAPAFDGDSEPNFITEGKIDGALDLNYSESYPPIFIPGTEEFFNFYQSGLTVSAWVNTSYVSGANWPAIFSKFDGAAGAGYAIAANGDPGAPLFDVDNTRIVAPAADSIADGGWHLLTVTFDGAVKKIYVDGLLKAESAPATTNAAANAAPVAIGAWGADAEYTYFEGLIDDIRVYSYALADTEVADLYIDVEGGWLCIGGRPEFDVDGNCKVDLADFAAFAEDWLTCNRYPLSECD